MEEKKKRGGRREGAGRKKKTEENRATTKTISMPNIVWERLDKACANKGVLRSRVIQEAINAWLMSTTTICK